MGIFCIHAMVERAEVRDLSNFAIFFGNNEAKWGPFGVAILFIDSNINHVLQFLFEHLFMSMENGICTVVYQSWTWQ